MNTIKCKCKNRNRSDWWWSLLCCAIWEYLQNYKTNLDKFR